jgi:hypothetical protein
MKKVVRLSESELTNLIKTVVKETKRNKKNGVNEAVENFFNPEAMSTGGAIATMVGTTIALLGIAGWDYLKDFYRHLRKTEGKEQEAMELKSIIQDYESNKMNSGEEMDSEVEVDNMDIEDEEPMKPMAENIRRKTRRY